MQINGKVLVCDAIDQAGINSLKRAGMIVDYMPDIAAAELICRAKEYQVIIVRSRTKITKEVIDAAINAKIIARVGVGLDNIDINAADLKNVRVINAAEAAINAVSELAIGHMISLARSIPYADAEIKKGHWVKKDLSGVELKGKYLGIVGVGKIGRNVARIAKALRINLIGYDLYPINKDFVREVGLITADLDTLVASADFITCHVPLTNETKHMFNTARFSKMKKNAFIINTSRGQIIDENALHNALTTGKIAGAALDVFEIEPPVNKMLIELPNVVCTPHIGSQTQEAQQLASTVIAEKIIQSLRGSDQTQ